MLTISKAKSLPVSNKKGVAYSGMHALAQTHGFRDHTGNWYDTKKMIATVATALKDKKLCNPSNFKVFKETYALYFGDPNRVLGEGCMLSNDIRKLLSLSLKIQ